MKRTWLIAALLVSGTPLLRAQWPYQQVVQTSACGSSGSVSSFTCKLTAAQTGASVTSGDPILIGLVYYNNTNTISITDSASTTYTRDAHKVSAASDYVDVWSGTAGGSGDDTITISISAGAG